MYIVSTHAVIIATITTNKITVSIISIINKWIYLTSRRKADHQMINSEDLKLYLIDNINYIVHTTYV